MIYSTVLETDRLLLRPPTIGDALRITSLAGDWDVAKTTLNMPHPYEVSMAEDFIQHIADSWDTGEDYTFALYLKTSGDLIGMMGTHPNLRHSRAEIGYWVGKEYWGQGYATEAARRMVRFVFEDLGLNRIEASYFVGNPASRRVMEKAGMTFEGIRRQYMHRVCEAKNYDEYTDTGFCGLLREDWQK
ncbi:MAG: GNAT family N-acetyltransferase [Anaerolineaceae bacterium]|nr:GNAT family N-acetyltransferase [Anaerolineaceae bacterium]